MYYAINCEDTRSLPDESQTISQETALRSHRRAEGRQRRWGRAPLCHPEARRQPFALRLSPGAGWNAQKLGRSKRPVARPGTKAVGCPGRGPSARICRLRGDHPGRRVRRRNGDGLGRRHLDARRRSGSRLPHRPTQVHSRRSKAQRKLGPRPHRPAWRPHATVAAHQAQRRLRQTAEQRRRPRQIAQERGHRPHDGRNHRGSPLTTTANENRCGIRTGRKGQRPLHQRALNVPTSRRLVRPVQSSASPRPPMGT